MSDIREYAEIGYDVRDGIARVLLDRPEDMNPLTPRLLTELRDALGRVDRDDAVRVCVIAGAGRAFSVGGDLGDLPRRSASGVPEGMDVGEYMLAMREELREWHDDYIRIAEMRKPVVAQVHGWCLGGAAWLAVAADITIAADDTIFAQPEVRQGMPAGVIWALAAGWKHALRYSLTGDRLGAEEAARIGLINEVVPADELAARVDDLARRIAQLPMDSIVLNKQLIRRSMDAMGFRQALQVGAELSGWLWGAWHSDVHGAFERAMEERGIAAAVRERDAPFRPEPTSVRKQA
jgi:enoyl-CoA hydratase